MYEIAFKQYINIAWVVGLKELMNVLHEVCEAGDWV